MLNYTRMAAFLLTITITLSIIGFTIPNVLSNVKLGLDLKGGFEVLYEASSFEENGAITLDSLRQTAKSLEKRINALGTTEPEIWTEGSNRIRVRLAGVADEQKVREILKKPAQLTVRGPDGAIELNGSDFLEGASSIVYGELQKPLIRVEVKDKQKLLEISTRLLHQKITFQLDETVLVEPVILVVLTEGISTLTGNYTYDQAKEIVDTINLGAIPLKLTEKYAQSVGASLGQLSLEQTVMAGAYASIIILLFMLVLYRIPGFIASFTLITYSWLLLGIMNWLGATLTLPGIAAFVLGIGMAVDANVITYERLKDEMRTGLSLLSALRKGYKNSFRTIMDSHVTTIIAAVVLFYVGTGAIKGFALTLVLSIGLSILTNVYFSQWLLRMLAKTDVFNNPLFFGVSRKQVVAIDKNEPMPLVHRAFDFVKHRKLYFFISILVTVIGIGSLLVHGLNYGVDFKAGTTIDVALGKPIEKNKAEEIVRKAGFDPSVVTVGGGQQDRVTVRFDRVLNADIGESDRILSAFAGEYGNGIGKEENTVDPGIAKELAFQAIVAVAVASIGIMLYVTIRFEWGFAVAAIIALVHDVFFVISVFSILKLEVNLPFIAAILTIVGYSINDTVVIFDRIRENLRFARAKTWGDLTSLVNLSINQTLVRSVNTAVTVLIASIALLVWGSDSINLFSLAMTVGLVVGMYSSIYIASQVWLTLKFKSIQRLERRALYLKNNPPPPPSPLPPEEVFESYEHTYEK
ncbi:protein translocase subunit SecDF [Paenibacillus sp. FSL H7-0331]|uniref:protein translocase subunit SecDF n=1 Tax=Paenibacillus sp. FSL H7-0331 TaxID=1920421 RepID=UPI00096BF401|nr:protein translocase subunit SecDF [Paenibacillus sp. FSL H7-0331]OMF03974.1 preprotein translocase subunit SecD [Paenibacillus sp. FSL H7-0331]